MRRAVQILLFLVLIAETGMMFAGQWKTPLSILGTLFLDGTPLKVPGVDLWMLAIWLVWGRRAKATKTVTKPMTRAIWLTMAASVAMILYGISRGGDYKQAVFQNQALLASLFFTLLLIRALRTPEDFYGLGKAIVIAAIWRSCMAILFYLVIVRTGNYASRPDYCTTHDDTVLFTLAFIIVLLNALELQTRKARRLTYWVLPLLLIAIQLNARRMAWVSLVAASVVTYILFRPNSQVKRKVNRALLIGAPFVLTYVLVGKHYAELPDPPSVFKPLSSIFSASDKNNPSTRSRDAENMGLVVTLNQRPILGSGFGHEYIEVDSTLAARAFAQYRYITHNSVLGFFAFTGMLGFFRIWMLFPTSVFFNVRIYRAARDPTTRIVAGSAVSGILIFINQAYGDMGLFSFTSLYLVACCNAAAARLAIPSGAWNAPSGAGRAVNVSVRPAAIASGSPEAARTPGDRG